MAHPLTKHVAINFWVPKSPDDWWEFNKALSARNIVWVMGNECQTHFMSIDPDTLQLKKILSARETLGLPPAKVLNATPAPEKWWEKPDIIPSAPKGEIQISGPPVLQSMCTVKIGATQTIQASPGALIIPDTTRAFLIGMRSNPSIQSERVDANTTVDYGSKGKPYCTIEPLITMPSPSSAMTIAGGGLRNPGRITAPAKPVEPAATAQEVIMTLPIIIGITMMTTQYLQTHQAQIANGVITYPSGADQLISTRQALGLSDTQLGQVALEVQTLQNSGVPANSDQSGGLIQDRNQMQPPGNCTPQQHEELQNEVNRACKQQGARSCSPQTTPAPIAANNISKAMACIAARQKINNMCFMGGDDAHLGVISDEYALIAKCAASINRPMR